MKKSSASVGVDRLASPKQAVSRWTEKHQREARRRAYELAAELAVLGRLEDADALGYGSQDAARTESLWRKHIGAATFERLTPDEPVYPIFDAARVDREVRRIDALATGRLVRETVWHCRTGANPDRTEQTRETEASARDWLRSESSGARIVRVTSIRRAR